MSPRRLMRPRALYLSGVLLLLATFIAPPAFPPSTLGALGVALGPQPASAGVLAQESVAEQATLETRRPTVQWSAVGATDWQTVATRQSVAVGDRVRTGQGAAARLVYFEGSVTEIEANTGLLVPRLERSPDGNLIARLYQSAGTTLSRVRQLVDPAGSFEVETPAAVAAIRGTSPRVQVFRDGTSRIANVPDDTGGTVQVQAKDARATQVTLQPGEETQVRPGQAPTTPTPIGTLQAQDEAQEAASEQAQQQQQQMLAAAQASAVGQGMAASFAAAQAAFVNAAIATELQRQLNPAPRFGFSQFPVVTGSSGFGR